MPRIQVPITTGFYRDNSLPLSAQECVNWYPQTLAAPSLSENNEVLRGVPGISQIASTGGLTFASRGAIAVSGVYYVVSGTGLYRINREVGDGGEETFLPELLGTIPGEGTVSLATNGTKLVVLVPGDPSSGYVYDSGADTFAEITDTDFKANGEPQAVVFGDGYFIYTTNTKKWIVSALNDPLSYNALDFGSAETDSSDATVAPIYFRGEVYIAGSNTIEGFQNIGGAGFPYQSNGLVVPRGVTAAFSLIQAGNMVLFIGGGPREAASVWAFSGAEASKISTIPVDDLLQDLTQEQLVRITSWSYAEGGSHFVGFNLPDTTLVFDVISGRWHERRSRYPVGSGFRLSRYRVESMTECYGRILVSDVLDGRIGELVRDVYTEYGGIIIRTMVTPPIVSGMEALLVPYMELTFESGSGNSQAPNPTIGMERSTDGKTWKMMRVRKMGKVGEYKRRAIWRGNGRASRFDVFRFTLSDPVKPVLISLTAELERG